MIANTVADELIAGAQKRTVKLAPGSVETTSGGAQALEHL
jgi:hypothetical protein